MSQVAWSHVFSEVILRADGASEADIETFVATIGQPLAPAELDDINGTKSRFTKPETWIIPNSPLPSSYLSFLRWSNGGEFRNGDRLLQFFPILDPIHGVRAMLLAYQVPYTHPGILPFAFNGGGIFYAFDMRYRPTNGEYPIVAADCGYSHFPYSLEATFLDTCLCKIDFELKWNEKDEITRPQFDECGEYLVCPECGKRGRVTH